VPLLNLFFALTDIFDDAKVTLKGLNDLDAVKILVNTVDPKGLKDVPSAPKVLYDS